MFGAVPPWPDLCALPPRVQPEKPSHLSPGALWARGAGAWQLPGMTYEMQAAMEACWSRAPWHSHFLGTHSLIHAADHRVWLPECWAGGGSLQQAWTQGSLSSGLGKTRWGWVEGWAGSVVTNRRTDRQTEPLECSHGFSFSRLNPGQPMSNSGLGPDSHPLPPTSQEGGLPGPSTRPPPPPGVYGWLPTSP